MSCWYSNASTWIFVLMLLLIIVVISFQIKETLFSKAPQLQRNINPFEDYGYITYSNDVTELEPYSSFQQQPQSIELFVPTPDELKFVQHYTRQPKNQLPSLNSINYTVEPQINPDIGYIPYDPMTRFQTPTYYTIQDRPDLSNFIRL